MDGDEPTLRPIEDQALMFAGTGLPGPAVLAVLHVDTDSTCVAITMFPAVPPRAWISSALLRSFFLGFELARDAEARDAA